MVSGDCTCREVTTWESTDFSRRCNFFFNYMIYFIFILFIYLFFYLFTFGRVGSSLLSAGFL